MSLCRRLATEDICDPLDIAERFFDDDFFTGFLDGELFVPPFYHRRYYVPPKRNALKRRRSASEEADASPTKKSLLNVDVRNYAPEEITVKTIDNSVVVHGKHEEESDGNGYVKREFVRRMTLPEDVDAETVTCSFSSDGVLTVQAPRKQASKSIERTVPIAVEHVKAKDSAPAVEQCPKQGS